MNTTKTTRKKPKTTVEYRIEKLMGRDWEWWDGPFRSARAACAAWNRDYGAGFRAVKITIETEVIAP